MYRINLKRKKSKKSHNQHLSWIKEKKGSNILILLILLILPNTMRNHIKLLAITMSSLNIHLSLFISIIFLRIILNTFIVRIFSSKRKSKCFKKVSIFSSSIKMLKNLAKHVKHTNKNF